MFFSGKLFSALLAVASVGVTGSLARLEKRGPPTGSIYICDGHNFDGSAGAGCQSVPVIDYDWCVHPPAGFNNGIGSFGPDDGVKCTVYVADNCMGTAVTMQKPGSPYLYGMGSSYSCHIVS